MKGFFFGFFRILQTLFPHLAPTAESQVNHGSPGLFPIFQSNPYFAIPASSQFSRAILTLRSQPVPNLWAKQKGKISYLYLEISGYHGAAESRQFLVVSCQAWVKTNDLKIPEDMKNRSFSQFFQYWTNSY